MGSKSFVVLGLLVAIVLVIPMEVAARELAETFINHKKNGDTVEKTNGVSEAKLDASRSNLDNLPQPYGGPKNLPQPYGGPKNLPQPYGGPQNPPYTYGGPQNPPYTYGGIPTPPRN